MILAVPNICNCILILESSMNLFDLPEKELFDIKEVGLVIRDIALSRIPSRPLSSSDQVIYSTEDFQVLLISNSVMLKRHPAPNENGYVLRFAFAANCDNINDARPWSTRYNTDRERYAIRCNSINSILKVNAINIFFNTVRGNEEYFDVIQEHINFSDMEPEIFQRALIEDKNVMNIIMLNYLFRNDLPYHVEPGVTFHGFVTELDLIGKAVPHIQELRKLC